jgi:hypothetical protein
MDDKAVVQQRLDVQRRHDEADARRIFRVGRHGAIVADGDGKFKSNSNQPSMP